MRYRSLLESQSKVRLTEITNKCTDQIIRQQELGLIGEVMQINLTSKRKNHMVIDPASIHRPEIIICQSITDMTKFTYDDIVSAKENMRSELRPGDKAWVVGVVDNLNGKEFRILPKDIYYVIEFEDGNSEQCVEAEIQIHPANFEPKKTWRDTL
jgi:hypothetical protein